MDGIIEIQDILEVEKYLDGIEGVVFDLDDTLYKEKDYVRSGFNAVGDFFTEIEDMSTKLWLAFEQGKKPIDSVLLQEGCYSQNNLKRALHIYRSHKPDIKLYPGVREMLGRIRENRKTGIITDGRPEGQRAKIEALGLNHLVDEIIITDELGGSEFRKPCDMAFKIMRERMIVPFWQMMYVGDNLKKDFAAPRKLGMRAVFYCNSQGLYSGGKETHE